MKYHDVAKKPKTFLVMTGCHLDEFNTLLPISLHTSKTCHLKSTGYNFLEKMNLQILIEVKTAT